MLQDSHTLWKITGDCREGVLAHVILHILVGCSRNRSRLFYRFRSKSRWRHTSAFASIRKGIGTRHTHCKSIYRRLLYGLAIKTFHQHATRNHESRVMCWREVTICMSNTCHGNDTSYEIFGCETVRNGMHLVKVRKSRKKIGMGYPH